MKGDDGEEEGAERGKRRMRRVSLSSGVEGKQRARWCKGTKDACRCAEGGYVAR